MDLGIGGERSFGCGPSFGRPTTGRTRSRVSRAISQHDPKVRIGPETAETQARVSRIPISELGIRLVARKRALERGRGALAVFPSRNSSISRGLARHSSGQSRATRTESRFAVLVGGPPRVVPRPRRTVSRPLSVSNPKRKTQRRGSAFCALAQRLSLPPTTALLRVRFSRIDTRQLRYTFPVSDLGTIETSNDKATVTRIFREHSSIVFARHSSRDHAQKPNGDSSIAPGAGLERRVAAGLRRRVQHQPRRLGPSPRSLRWLHTAPKEKPPPQKGAHFWAPRGRASSRLFPHSSFKIGIYRDVVV